MAADASIFSQYLAAPKSVAEYGADYDKAESNKLTLAGLRMSNQTAEQGVADDQAARQAMIQSGGDAKKALNALQAAGLYKQAQAMQKSILENQETQSKIDLNADHGNNFKQITSASDYEIKVKKHDQAIKDIASFQTPQQAVDSINMHIQNKAITPEQGQAMMQSLPKDPAQFATWQIGKLRGLMTAKEQMAYAAPDANTVANNTTSIANNTATNATSRANNAASNATTQRGQNMTDGRARETNATTMSKPFEVTGPDGLPVLVQQDKSGKISPVQGFTPKGQGVKPMPATALKMQQTSLDAINIASNTQADLGAIEKQIADGKLDFGPVSNLWNKGRNAAGMSSEESRNLSTFKSSLEKMRNDSLRLNAGVQTDGDAQRAWNELFENINDKGVVTQRLAEIKKLNSRAVVQHKLNVDGIRANFGRAPMDTTGYENQGPAVGLGNRAAADKILGL